MADKIIKSETQWQQQLSDEQYKVTRQHATEAAFSGEYHDCKDAGHYACICCAAELFNADTKFDSGTGWPSFYQPISVDAVAEQTDTSHFMARTEVHCAHCDAHLGHVFADGPPPTGLRYCINSASLTLNKA